MTGTSKLCGLAALAASLAIAPPASADAPSDGPASTNTPSSSRANRARFSGKRLIVEALAGAVVGSLVGYGTYSAAGGEGIGATMAGLGAEIAVAPLVVWGTGRAMGGQGTVGSAYLGGLVAFSGPAATADQAAVSFALGMALMPITSALMFEISSQVRSKRFETIASGLSIVPVADGGGLTGVRAGLSFGF